VDKYYTTKKLVGHKKAELWRQFISDTFVELDCNGMSKRDFFGELRARSVCDIEISTITTDAYDVFRTKSGISDSSMDDFIISVQTQGSATIKQLDREVTLKPGDFTIYDATMPYHLHFESRLSQLVVKVPRTKLKEHIRTPERFSAIPIQASNGITQITTNFAKSIFDQTNQLNDKNQAAVADTLLSLLTASIREATAQVERAPRNRETQLLRVKQFIGQNLCNSELTVRSIADAHHITERYVQTLFDNEGITPARYIWNQRLQAAENDLVNPLLSHRSVSEICYAWGFNDTAHFSRAFKKKYGLSPRTYRNR
jgi:AraC-like DNA-binding protein